MGLLKACQMIGALASMPPAEKPGEYTELYGDAAKDLSERDALRLARRIERRAASGGHGRPLAPHDLAKLSKKNRRRR